jgi:V/A-type H+-transporting ATPase subunit D
VSGPAIRSRLLTLQQERLAARLGRELLDSKREAILRELLQRIRRRDAVRAAAQRLLQEARAALQEALVEMGGASVDAAVLAQPVFARLDVRPGSLVGVSMLRLHVRPARFAPHYGTGATTASLDAAGARFASLLPALGALAEEEEAVRNLQAGLFKTVRRLKALEQVVIPRLERDLHSVAAALEEEERDESTRRRSWLAAGSGRPRAS